MAKIVVISEVNGPELNLVLDKVLGANGCPLRGGTGGIGGIIVQGMAEMPPELREILRAAVETVDRTKNNKGGK